MASKYCVYDGGMIPNVKLRQFVVDTADKLKIKYHFSSMARGTTDGSRIHMSRAGVPTIVARRAGEIHSRSQRHHVSRRLRRFGQTGDGTGQEAGRQDGEVVYAELISAR